MTRYLRAIACAIAALCAVPASAQDPGWVALFDGKTLAGWQAAERPESWKVEDGALVTAGDRSHLFYVGPVANHDFRNFEFAAEVMTAPRANGGIYVHTKLQGPGWPEAGYELQVVNSTLPPVGNAYVEHKMTGSIYAIRNTWRSSVRDNEWFRYRIRVVGKTIQTYINDVLTCEYTEPENPFRPADKRGRLLGSGTFALQAHDPASLVRYRAIRVRVLPDTLPSTGTPLADRELDELITRLSNDNVPLIDVGLIVPVGAAAEPVLAKARQLGVTPGSQVPLDAIGRTGRSVFVVNDRDVAPDPAVLQSARAAGARIAFSSGGDNRLDEVRLKRRLQAMLTAGLGWQDLWVPGRN